MFLSYFSDFVFEAKVFDVLSCRYFDSAGGLGAGLLQPLLIGKFL